MLSEGSQVHLPTRQTTTYSCTFPSLTSELLLYPLTSQSTLPWALPASLLTRPQALCSLQWPWILLSTLASIPVLLGKGSTLWLALAIGTPLSWHVTSQGSLHGPHSPDTDPTQFTNTPAIWSHPSVTPPPQWIARISRHWPRGPSSRTLPHHYLTIKELTSQTSFQSESA